MAKVTLRLTLKATRETKIRVVLKFVHRGTGIECTPIDQTVTVGTTEETKELTGTFDHTRYLSANPGYIVATLEIYDEQGNLLYSDQFTLGAKITDASLEITDKSNGAFKITATVVNESDVATRVYIGASLVGGGEAYNLQPLQADFTYQGQTVTATFKEKRGGGTPTLTEAYEKLGTDQVTMVVSTWAYYDSVNDLMYGRYHKFTKSYKIPDEYTKPQISVSIVGVYIE